MIFTFVVVPLIDSELSALMADLPDHEILKGHVTAEELRKDGIEPLNASEEQSELALARANDIIQSMDKPTREARTEEAREASKALMTSVVASESKLTLFRESMFSPIDLLFVVIAVASAFKVATFGGQPGE